MGWCYVDRTSPVTWVPCIVVRSLAGTNHGGPGIWKLYCGRQMKKVTYGGYLAAKVTYEGERVGAGSSTAEDSCSINGSTVAPDICYKYISYIFVTNIRYGHGVTWHWLTLNDWSDVRQNAPAWTAAVPCFSSPVHGFRLNPVICEKQLNAFGSINVVPSSLDWYLATERLYNSPTQSLSHKSNPIHLTI